MVWASLYLTESCGAMERSIADFDRRFALAVAGATTLKGMGLSGRSRTAEIAKDPPLPIPDGAMRLLATTLHRAFCFVVGRVDRRFPVRARDFHVRANIRACGRGAICGLLHSQGDGSGIGEGPGFQVHFFPMLIVVAKFEFGLEFVKGEEQKFADEGQVGGVAGRDTVLGNGLVEFAKD